ncbi:unnamed protein product, partial [Ilex paraguariensis]
VRSDGKYTAFPFPEGQFHGGTTVSPLFHHLSEKLFNCYQSIDFLCKLNKTRELKTEILKEGKLLEHFIDQLRRRTHSEKVQTSKILEKSVHQDLSPIFQPSYDYTGRISVCLTSSEHLAISSALTITRPNIHVSFRFS